MTDYCPPHVEACEAYGRDFGPFPGCSDCPKPDGFNWSGQFHLCPPSDQLKEAA